MSHNLCSLWLYSHITVLLQRHDEIVETILEWWQVQQRGQLKSGIWQTGIQGKL
jgi:hypothetical protein